MCGITGLFSTDSLQQATLQSFVQMNQLLQHRGPDASGYFYANKSGYVQTCGEGPVRLSNCNVALGHRRLKILDLSSDANQPMLSEDKKIALSYNGEVYNYENLRSELAAAGFFFRTRSDTEVILRAYEHWGIDCIQKFRGIFAFCLVDFRKGKVFLVRDHLGVKPLYVTKVENVWSFASEQKAFLKLFQFSPELDPQAIQRYLHFLWIPGRHTGLKNVWKLEPGHIFEFDLDSGEASVRAYWNPSTFLCTTAPQRRTTFQDEADYCEEQLRRAVREQMASDVPLGAFLSGGLDSSLIVALMKEALGSGHQISTFTVGFKQSDLKYDIVPDDLIYARKMVDFLGVKNQEIILSPDIEDLFPKLVWELDEPLGDPAAIPAHLISKAARHELTVMLSGVGGDELFMGYPRQRALLYGNFFRSSPLVLQNIFHKAIEQFPAAGRSRLSKWGRAGKKFVRGAKQSPLDHYIAMETYFNLQMQERLIDPAGPLAVSSSSFLDELEATKRRVVERAGDDPLKQSMVWDLMTYLPCLNLMYSDRTSMANSVEQRVPFLDVPLVEGALRVRSEWLLKPIYPKPEGKYLLKKIAEKYLPHEVVWRKKAGFGAPVRSWLRGELNEMREELLGPNGIGRRGWFYSDEISAVQNNFLTGKEDNSLQIWMLMSLELWARQYVDQRY